MSFLFYLTTRSKKKKKLERQPAVTSHVNTLSGGYSLNLCLRLHTRPARLPPTDPPGHQVILVDAND
jgi:hypothetical protein